MNASDIVEVDGLAEPGFAYHAYHSVASTTDFQCEDFFFFLVSISDLNSHTDSYTKIWSTNQLQKQIPLVALFYSLIMNKQLIQTCADCSSQ